MPETVTRAGTAQPLPNEFLTLPLPGPHEFARDGYGTYRQDSLGEAMVMAAEVARDFGASGTTVHRIYRLTDQLATYLPYAPYASAVLEGAYRGEEPQREHVAPVLAANHRSLPWRTRRHMDSLGVHLGGEAVTTFALGGLRAALAESPEAHGILTAKARPLLDRSRPYIERYAAFENGPRETLQREVSTLLHGITAASRYAAGQRRTRQGEKVDQAKLNRNPDHYVGREDVGEGIRLVALEVLEGRAPSPMITTIIGDILSAAHKDAATTAQLLRTLDPRAFTVGAHRIIKILNTALPRQYQHTQLEKLTGGVSGLGMAVGMLPGRLGRKYRALGKVPTIVSAVMRHVPTTNNQLTYPLHVMDTLTDPQRPTITIRRGVGRVAVAHT